MLPFEVEWRVPVGCGYSGFFVEVVLGFLPGLLTKGLPVRLLTGRCDEAWLRSNLEAADADVYVASWTDEHTRAPAATAASLVIEHGEPCYLRTWRHGSRPWRVVARTMTEADLKHEQVACLHRADEIWVPTAWHVDKFAASGIARSTMHVVPEPVDTAFFDPALSPREARPTTSPFVFFSSFKWEFRKGWDLLLRAFWAEFSSRRERRSVRLVLKTYLPPWEPGPRSLEEQTRRFGQHHFGRQLSQLAPVELREHDISRRALRELYAAADAFVLPTRGEGWGLPIAEAMAMGLPVIATNWSGPTAFLREANSHPLPVARHLTGGFAEPGVTALRHAMRRAFDEHTTNGGEAATARGRRARQTMVEEYSRAAVAEVVLRRLGVLNASWAPPADARDSPHGQDELRRHRRLALRSGRFGSMLGSRRGRPWQPRGAPGAWHQGRAAGRP